MLLYLCPILFSPSSSHWHFETHALVKYSFIVYLTLTRVAWNTMLTSSEESPRWITSISSSIKILIVFLVEPAYAVISSCFHHCYCRISVWEAEFLRVL
jgi:hypothetical protein